MRFSYRPTRAPEDFVRVVEICNTFLPEPITLDKWETWYKNLPNDAEVQLTSVDDESGRLVGYAEATRMPWSNPGQFYVEVYVDPAVRRQGIGDTLLEGAESFARSRGGTNVEVGVRDHLPHCVAFAERRGYEVRRHLFESTLDLSRFDDSQFAGVVDAVRAGGISFFTLADRRGPDLERAIYEFDKETAFDIPGWDREQFTPFDEWQKRVLQSPDLLPDCFILAAEGGRIAGHTRLERNKQTGAMYTDYTAVRKEFRGRNIALALKLLSVDAARRYGAPYMRTNNDSENAPMLAVNRKMGYVPSPGIYFMRKQLI